MFRRALHLLTVFSTSAALAQEPYPAEWALCPSIASQGQVYGELDIMRAQVIEGHGVLILYGPFAGVATNFGQGERIIVPKAGYELAMSVITVRASTACYYGEHNSDLRFLPEVGLSFFGLADLTYGWALPLTDDRIPELARHRFALTVNLHRTAWGILGVKLPFGKKDDRNSRDLQQGHANPHLRH